MSESRRGDLPSSRYEMSQSHIDRPFRRQFLNISASSLAAGLVMAGPQRLLCQASAENRGVAKRGSGVKLEANKDHSLLRVRLELDVKGNVNLPKNPLISRARERQLPITSKATFDYEERFRQPVGAVTGSPIIASERFYHEGHSSSVVDRTRKEVKLRDSVRRAVVRRDSLPEVIYCRNDYFTHEELELLRLPASSAAVEELLPGDPVHVGSSYEIDAEAIASLLNLSLVDIAEVTAEVVEMTESAAKLKLRGKVEGYVDGVPTVTRLLGKMTFDRQLGMTTWLALALHEKREIGNAEPGFDVAATIKMLRKPLDKPVRLAKAPPKLPITTAIPADRLLVKLSSDELGFSVLMNRRWRMMRDVPGSAMMRMIDHDRSIAQCVFRAPAKLEPGRHRTLEAFQGDVEQTLGDQLRQLTNAEQRLTESGLRALTVTAQGEAEGVPVMWIMLHLSDDSGRRLLATFTMSADSVDAFAGSDVQLANSLQLIDPGQEASGTVSEEEIEGSEEEKPEAEVASMSDSGSGQLQSKGELR